MLVQNDICCDHVAARCLLLLTTISQVIGIQDHIFDHVIALLFKEFHLLHVQLEHNLHKIACLYGLNNVDLTVLFRTLFKGNFWEVYLYLEGLVQFYKEHVD